MPVGINLPFIFKLGTTGFDCITKDDAKYVQIIHTTSGRLGVAEQRGHADFYPNGGKVQHGCMGIEELTCSHARSWVYFQESVRNEKAFIGIQCRSSELFENAKCENESLAVMGYSSDSLPVGRYFLSTASNKFHAGLGYEGLRDTKFMEINGDKVKMFTPYNPETSLKTKFENVDLNKNNMIDNESDENGDNRLDRRN